MPCSFELYLTKFSLSLRAKRSNLRLCFTEVLTKVGHPRDLVIPARLAARQEGGDPVPLDLLNSL